MERRQFLAQSAIGTTLLSASGIVLGSEKNTWAQVSGIVKAEDTIKADVLVIGGGTAGTIAAIQAARAGAKTILVERGSQLGGTTTVGGVDFPGLFHGWGKQVIAGIGWDLVKKAVEMNGDTLQDFSDYEVPHPRHHIQLNAPLYALLAEEEALKAGVMLEYYQIPLAAESVSDGWLLDVVGKGMRQKIVCKQLIDCTGGADIVGMLGFARMREEIIQPGTLRFKLAGYDYNKLDHEDVQKRYLKAIEDGQLIEGDWCHVKSSFKNFLRKGGVNAQHIFDADSSTATTHTQANIAGRRSLLRLLRFIQSIPGCEKARIEKMAQETAIRETYRIVGEKMVTVDDYTGGRVFDDALCYSFYPIDVHDKHGVKPEKLSFGKVPTIPLGALVPKSSRNLLVAGRSLSSDRLANSAARVQASCMAMGQAAGATAALAAKQNTTPLKVNLGDIHAVLKNNGAIVPTL